MSPDITLCSSKTCRYAKSCYRKTAKPDAWQSYADYTPRKGEPKCKHYWPDARIVRRAK